MARHRREQPTRDFTALHIARLVAEGSGRHPYFLKLIEETGAHAARNLADAVHLLCHLYGARPGVLQTALDLGPGAKAHPWLSDAADAFERERLYLLRLSATVEAMPSTAGAAETAAALVNQRGVLNTLMRSERTGCALGAAIALVIDWKALRRLLDRAAERVGIERPLVFLPDEAAAVRALNQMIVAPAIERAINFGSEQLLLQHRGFLDLLEARAGARGGD